MSTPSILIYDIDGTLMKQHLNAFHSTRTIDCRKYEQQIAKYIPSDSNMVNVLRATIDVQTPKGFHISFYGSGDFHHLTLMQLQRLTKPFHLIVFDHHYDTGTFRFKKTNEIEYDFSSWVYSAAHLEYCTGITMVGVNTGFFKEIFQDVRYLKKNFNFKVISKKEEITSSYKEALKEIDPEIDVFLSIDKDVLNEDIVITDWDAGLMSDNQLFECLLNSATYFGKNIIGVDVCGEARRLGSLYTPEEKQKNTAKHSYVNQAIIKLLLNYLRYTDDRNSWDSLETDLFK
ncbi:arginase family protein [bacterium]|nr:arginase family protein [bacterium]